MHSYLQNQTIHLDIYPCYVSCCILKLKKFRFSVIAVMSRSYNQGLKKQYMNRQIMYNPCLKKLSISQKRLTKRMAYSDERKEIKQGGCSYRGEWIGINQWSQLVLLSPYNHAVRENISLSKKKKIINFKRCFIIGIFNMFF